MTTARLIVVASVVSGIFLGSATASAQLYPACDANSLNTCSMTDTGMGNVLIGAAPLNVGEGNAVSLYPIFYGSWNSGPDQYLFLDIFDLLASVTDTTYEAIAETYSAPNGTTAGRFVVGGVGYDTNKSQGSDLTLDVQLQRILANQIANGLLPRDPNGVYLVFTDTDVVFSAGSNFSFCQTFAGTQNTCGFNRPISVPQLSGDPTLHLAVIGNGLGCTNLCAYGFLTPNTANGADIVGAIDKTLAAMMHELNESITDPFGANGWTNAQLPPLAQMADFCASQSGSDFYYMGNGALTNFHGAYGDFLIDPLRVNANGGYCANSYGGVFWEQNFGYQWNPTGGDWASGSFKGECAPGQPLIGMSDYYTTGVQGHAHSIMCGLESAYSSFPQSTSCTKVPLSGAGTVQCPTTSYFVAGVAQDTGGHFDGILCCPLGNNLNVYGCNPNNPFDSANLPNSETTYDWDYFYLKAECSYGSYVWAVTVSNPQGPGNIPTSLTCCGLH